MDLQPGMKTTDGYLALPASGKGPGILVFHAWWGLNDFFVNVCERLAEEGFVALAPDLYEGAVVTTIEDAEQVQGKMDFEAAQIKSLQSLDFLRQHPAVQGDTVGALGCSMGAAWALELSSQRPEDISAAVLFYSVSDADFTRSRAAYLGHFAENDAWDSVDDARKMEADMRAAGREVTLYVYPGVGHWFFEEDRPDAYNAEAARLAWERTVEFLQTHFNLEKASKDRLLDLPNV